MGLRYCKECKLAPRCESAMRSFCIQRLITWRRSLVNMWQVAILRNQPREARSLTRSTVLSKRSRHELPLCEAPDPQRPTPWQRTEARRRSQNADKWKHRSFVAENAA